MKYKIAIILLIFLTFSCTQSQIKNPDYVCKECGDFDVSELKFDENVEKLTSKTRTTITAITNYNIEKRINEIEKHDVIIAYKYKIRNKLNEDLGKDHFNYNNIFKFNNLSFLIDSKKAIVGFKSYTDYNGSAKHISNLIEDISKDLNTKPKKNLLLADGSEIYSWNSMLYLYQVMVTENKTDQYYVSLFVVKKDKFGTELKNSLNNDETFIFFYEKSFKK